MGNEWSAKQEVLAWGGGSQLVMRVRTMGRTVGNMRNNATHGYGRRFHLDQHHHQVEWITYREPWHIDGRDDITSINILRPPQRGVGSTSVTSEDIILGRASGSLESVTISPNRFNNIVTSRFMTGGRPVRAADLNDSSLSPLLAACLSDTAVCVYPINDPSSTIDPIAELTVIPAGKNGRTWSTRFLSVDRLAVGLGPSLTPVHIYQARPDGVNKEPIRTFGATDTNFAPSGDDQVNTGDSRPSGTSSVYSIAAIPPSSSAGGNVGDLLLSGWYDGRIRCATALDCPFDSQCQAHLTS